MKKLIYNSLIVSGVFFWIMTLASGLFLIPYYDLTGSLLAISLLYWMIGIPYIVMISIIACGIYAIIQVTKMLRLDANE